jgi:hypothetical protein
MTIISLLSACYGNPYSHEAGFAIVIAQKWSLSNLRDAGWMPCPG